MPTMQPDTRTTVFLQIGQTLTITGNATVIRLADANGGEPYPPSTATTFGPYDITAQFRIVAHGPVTYDTTGTPSTAPNRYVRRIPGGRATTVFVPAGSFLTVTGNARAILSDNGQTYYNGTDMALGPYEKLRIFSVIVTDGWLTIATAFYNGTAPTPVPTPTPTPVPDVFRLNYLDDAGANGVFYGNNSGPAASYYADLDETHIGIQRYDFSTGAVRKLNTMLIYKHATREALLGGVMMEDTGAITGTADHHGVHAGARWKRKFEYAFGGVHNDALKVSLSTDNGRTWVAQPTLGSSLCYPHPVVTDDNILMWIRQASTGNYPLVFWQGVPNEDTGVMSWGSMIRFIDLGNDTRVYLGEPVVYQGRVYLPVCRANATDSIRQDVYIFVYDIASKTVRNLQGTATYTLAQLPILRTDADSLFRVINQTDANTQGNTPSIVVDAEGVHVSYQDGPEGLSHSFARFSHAGVLIEGPFVVGPAPYRYATANIIPTPRGIDIYYPSPEGGALDMDTRAVYERGGSIWRRTRTAANTWSAPELLHAATPVHPLDSICRVKDGKADLRAMWAERAILDDDFTTGGNLRTFGYGDGGFVTTPLARDADAVSFLAGVTYSDEQFVPLHNFMRTIKQIGALDRTDYIMLHGELVETLALKSITGGYVASKTGPNVVHMPGKGFRSTGDKLTINFNPTTATNRKMSLTAMTLAIYPTGDTQEATSDMGSTDTTNVTLTLGSRSNSNNASTRLADANGAPTRPVTYANMLIMSQRLSGTKRLYTRSKLQVSPGAVAATRFPDGFITILGNGAAVTSRPNGISYGGGSTDVGPLAQAFKRYAFERLGEGV